MVICLRQAPCGTVWLGRFQSRRSGATLTQLDMLAHRTALALSALAFVACSAQHTPASDSTATTATATTATTNATASTASAGDPSAAVPTPAQVAVSIPNGMQAIRVFKDASCGCCKSWVSHMQQNGFKVTAIDEQPATLDSIKQAHGVTEQTASCHTAEVGNYVIEGHVPADLVAKLLRDHPSDVAGLSVPGMVTGSPGMEGPDPQHYTVVALMRDGTTRPYASR